MTSKRKRQSRVPTLTGHPSQSSIDVPAKVKKEVKERQDSKCWLCNKKAHKKQRPLEICHIIPQAKISRYDVSHLVHSCFHLYSCNLPYPNYYSL
jgi:5-methylcytosine-specific restriction endonuclease McrA